LPHGRIRNRGFPGTLNLFSASITIFVITPSVREHSFVRSDAGTTPPDGRQCQRPRPAKANIEPDGKRIFKKLARLPFSVTTDKLEAMLWDGDLHEITQEE